MSMSQSLAAGAGGMVGAGLGSMFFGLENPADAADG